jgi:hypothetical protein
MKLGEMHMLRDANILGTETPHARRLLSRGQTLQPMDAPAVIIEPFPRSWTSLKSWAGLIMLLAGTVEWEPGRADVEPLPNQ